MTVKEIMTQDPLTIEVPGTREDVLEKIWESGIFAFPCVKKGTKELVGIITEEDLIQKPNENQVAMLMTRDVITATINTKIIDAVKIMLKEGAKRLPVTTIKDEKEGIKEVVGIIAMSDVIKKIIARLETEKTVQNYYNKDIVAVWENTPLRVVWKIMNLSGQKALPTLDNKGKMSGIVTIDDLVGAAEVVGRQKTSQTGNVAEYTASSWDSVEILIIFSKSDPDFRKSLQWQRNIEAIKNKFNTIIDEFKQFTIDYCDTSIFQRETIMQMFSIALKKVSETSEIIENILEDFTTQVEGKASSLVSMDGLIFGSYTKTSTDEMLVNNSALLLQTLSNFYNTIGLIREKSISLELPLNGFTIRGEKLFEYSDLQIPVYLWALSEEIEKLEGKLDYFKEQLLPLINLFL